MTEKENIEHKICIMAILHSQAADLPLNCTLDQFCEATKDKTCPDRLKRHFFSTYRIEILTFVKEWTINRHQEVKNHLTRALEAREKQLPVANTCWRKKGHSGRTPEDDYIEELEQELASAEYKLKFKNMEII